MAVPFSNTTLRVPHGFPNLLEGFAREVLRHQPKDIYGFGAKYFEGLLLKREETGIEDLAQLGAKLNDRYYNSEAYCTGTCNINNAEHQEAAVRIQAEYRRHLASQETEHLREQNAATRIQANYRGYRDRKLVNVMKENERDMDHSEEQLNKEDEAHLESVRDIDQTSVLPNHTISPNNQLFEENRDFNQLSQSQKYSEDEAATIIQSRYRGHLQRERFHSTTKIKRIFINNDDSNDDIVTENNVVIDQTSNSSHHHRHSDSVQSPIESKEIDIEEKVTGKELLNNNKIEENFRISDDEISSHQEGKNLESDKQITNDYFIEDSNENTTEDISIANNTESEEQTTEKTPRKEDEEADVEKPQNSGSGVNFSFREAFSKIGTIGGGCLTPQNENIQINKPGPFGKQSLGLFSGISPQNTDTTDAGVIRSKLWPSSGLGNLFNFGDNANAKRNLFSPPILSNKAVGQVVDEKKLDEDKLRQLLNDALCNPKQEMSRNRLIDFLGSTEYFKQPPIHPVIMLCSQTASPENIVRLSLALSRSVICQTNSVSGAIMQLAIGLLASVFTDVYKKNRDNHRISCAINCLLVYLGAIKPEKDSEDWVDCSLTTTTTDNNNSNNSNSVKLNIQHYLRLTKTLIDYFGPQLIPSVCNCLTVLLSEQRKKEMHSESSSSHDIHTLDGIHLRDDIINSLEKQMTSMNLKCSK